MDYVSADLALPFATVKVDITHLPFDDHDFDAVVCLHVLEHIPDDRRAMSEIFRVMKPGSWAIMMVPMDKSRPTTLEDPTIVSPQERLRLYGQEDHVRFYGADFTERLRQAGFTVTIDGYAGELSPETVRAYALDATEDIFLCRKP